MGPENYHVLFFYSMTVIGFFCALGVRALFAFLETTITGLQIYHLDALAHHSPVGKIVAHVITQRSAHLLIIILFISSISDIIAGTLATSLVTKLLTFFHITPAMGQPLGIAVASMAIIVWGEIIPKNSARQKGARVLTRYVPLLHFLMQSTRHLAQFLIVLSQKATAVMTPSSVLELSPSLPAAQPHEIISIVTYAYQQGTLDHTRAALIQSLCNLDTTSITDYMEPISTHNNTESTPQILSMHLSGAQALAALMQAPYHRAFIYDNKQERIVGSLSAHTLLDRLIAQQLLAQAAPTISTERSMIYHPHQL